MYPINATVDELDRYLALERKTIMDEMKSVSVLEVMPGTTKYIQVNERELAALLGQQGKLLKHIEKTSGCQLNVSSEKTLKHGSITVTMTGNIGEIETAEEQMQYHLDPLFKAIVQGKARSLLGCNHEGEPKQEPPEQPFIQEPAYIITQKVDKLIECKAVKLFSERFHRKMVLPAKLIYDREIKRLKDEIVNIRKEFNEEQMNSHAT